jgi:hypothetical protein
MPKVKSELLKPGMVVTADVKNMDNMLLIPAGATLAQKQIDILQAWGVTEIHVEAAGELDNAHADPLAQLPPETASRLAAEVKSLFWRLDEADPVHMEILRLVLHRQARTLLGGMNS